MDKPDLALSLIVTFVIVFALFKGLQFIGVL